MSEENKKYIMSEFVKKYLLVPDQPDLFKKVGDDLNYRILVDEEYKFVMLHFEDSDGKRDWCNNLNFPKKVYKNQESVIEAHGGFVNAYKSGNDEVMEDFISAYNERKDYEPIICGWSHGAAIAQLAFEDFNYRTRVNKSAPTSGVLPTVITIGGPRVYKKDPEITKYLSICSKNIYNIRYKWDPVTKVPFEWMGFQTLGAVNIGKGINFFNLFNPYYSHMDVYAERDKYQVLNELPSQKQFRELFAL